MARRIVELVEWCEHGNDFCDQWAVVQDVPGEALICEGGSRRVLDPGSYVLIEKVDGAWPEDAIRTMAAAWINSPHPTLGHQIIDGLDALAGGEQP